MKVKPYVKAIVATVGAVAVAAQVALEDNALSTQEWGVIVTALATAVAVYFFPNSDK